MSDSLPSQADEFSPEGAAILRALDKSQSLISGINGHVTDVRMRERRVKQIKLFDIVSEEDGKQTIDLRTTMSRKDHPDHQLLLKRAERYAKGEQEIAECEKALAAAGDADPLAVAQAWTMLNKRRIAQGKELEALEDSLAKERAWSADNWKTCAKMVENMAVLKQRQTEHGHKMQLAGLDITNLTDAELEK